MVIKVKNLLIYPKISCGLCEMTFSLGNEVKQNILCLHGNNIETFLMRHLQIFIFFQIKKPFEICQLNIQVKKTNFN